MPLITRQSSTRGLPGLPCGRWGSIAAQASSDNQNKCVIAASLSVRLNEGRDSPKYSTCCMSSQPRACTHKPTAKYLLGCAVPTSIIGGKADMTRTGVDNTVAKIDSGVGTRGQSLIAL